MNGTCSVKGHRPNLLHMAQHASFVGLHSTSILVHVKACMPCHAILQLMVLNAEFMGMCAFCRMRILSFATKESPALQSLVLLQLCELQFLGEYTPHDVWNLRECLSE